MAPARHFSRAARLALAGAALCAAAAASAGPYPDRPIRVIVPYAAGGADLYVRPLQQKLQELLGQPMVVENTGGGGGVVGATKVKNSPADGYTVLFSGSGPITTAPKITGAPYTWHDFAPVANVIAVPFTLAVRSDSDFKTFKDFMARARANPGKVSYGSPGHGTSTQIAIDAMAADAKISITEIPYPGGIPALNALLGGHIDTAVATPSIVTPQVEAGAVRALVVTGPERFVPTPDVPTLREMGVNVSVVSNYGFFVPQGTPPDIVRKLAEAIRVAASDPKYIALMRSGYNDVNFLGPDAFRQAIVEEDRYFGKLIQDMGLAKQ